jgi:ABC-type Fe2+-enterobactin transport system substrate-binding protein
VNKQTLWIIGGAAIAVVLYIYWKNQSGVSGGTSGVWTPNTPNRVVSTALPVSGAGLAQGAPTSA